MGEYRPGQAEFLRPSNDILNAHEKERLSRLWNHGIRIYVTGKSAGQIFVERKRNKPFIFSSLKKAERGMQKLLDFYLSDFSEESQRLGEILSVNSLRSNISSLHDKALLGSRLKAEDKEIAAKEIATARELLQNCRNQIKVGLREKYASLEDFLDSLGRVNTGASAAKLVLMAKQARERAEDVRAMVRWASERKLILLEERLTIESHIEQALNRVDFLYSRPSWIARQGILLSYSASLKELLRSCWCLPYSVEVKKILIILSSNIEKSDLDPNMKRGIIKSFSSTLQNLINP